MKHRGPDVPAGCLSKNGFQLGHCRLKILDLDDRSNQPFWSRNKRYVMIYNGEVYNYRELANKYNIQTNTSSDTEVLLELYVVLGEGVLQEIEGMFSFVIFDTISNTFFVARDHLGVKPLYYSQTKDGWIFSSEIAPILNLLDSVKIDSIGLRQYKKLRTFFNGRTLYSEIKMFPAGHFMVNGHLKSYWQLSYEPSLPPSDEEILNLLKTSVQDRCLSDVPVGCYLSGGIDSTLIASLANKPDTWTVGFADNNEFEFARLAADKIGSTHNEILITREEFLETAKLMIKIRREPLSVPNEILLYHMTRMAKKKNTVILSGEGADELFFGYDRIFRWASSHDWDLQEFSSLYAYGSHHDLEIIEDVVAPFLKHEKTINIVAAFFQVAHLHGLLRRLDNSTMLCSVEARVPFVDCLTLVERMAGVPFEYRMKNGIVKEPLKRIFSSFLPNKIVQRQKVGFPVPLGSINFVNVQGKTGVDRWLNFNLQELGIFDAIEDEELT